WGSNASGQLGLGDNSTRGAGSGEMGDSLAIVDLGSGRTAKAIAAGNQHTCAILDNSSVKCWGANASGQLGLGDDDNRGDGANEMGDDLDAVDLGSGRTAKAIATGDSHTCALLDNALVKCWGENGNGQLGQGGIDDLGDGSGEMGESLTAITDSAGNSVTATSITTGTGYTCVLLDVDSVKCWGRNDYGQLGAGKTEEDHEPTLRIDLGDGITATAIASGYFHTCAIL
ncbi:uncharacterized protein METZ01_LOCUS516257, partial [marine metagenome]